MSDRLKFVKRGKQRKICENERPFKNTIVFLIFLYFYIMFTETTYRLAGVERSRSGAKAERRRSRDPAAGGKNR